MKPLISLGILLMAGAAAAGELQGWCRVDDVEYSRLSPLPVRIDLRNDSDQAIELADNMNWLLGGVKLRFRRQGSQDRPLILAGPDNYGCGFSIHRHYLPRRGESIRYETMPLWKLPEELNAHDKLEVIAEVIFKNGITVTTKPAPFRLKPVSDELRHTVRLEARAFESALHLASPSTDKSLQTMLGLREKLPEDDLLAIWLNCRCALYEICHVTGKTDQERNVDKIVDTLRQLGPIQREGLGIYLTNEIYHVLSGAQDLDHKELMLNLAYICIEPARGVKNTADHLRAMLRMQNEQLITARLKERSQLNK